MSPGVCGQIGLWSTPLVVLSTGGNVVFWLFSRALFEDDFKLNWLMSARLDEGTLARFWGSLNQPVRPALQAFSLANWSPPV